MGGGAVAADDVFQNSAGFGEGCGAVLDYGGGTGGVAVRGLELDWLV